MLVGNFARALFLVHSECLESGYITPRPFRVNAGPLHAYALAPNDRTTYLSELRAGQTVLVCDAAGRTRDLVVGRVKIEPRPLILVEAETADGERHSVILQNAETVRLMRGRREEEAEGMGKGVGAGAGGDPARWSVSVSDLRVGDRLLLRREGGGRHTGMALADSSGWEV